MKNIVEKLDQYRAYIFWSLLGLIVLCGAVYGYSVNQTVLNIVEYENTQTRISALTTRIGELEFKKIALKNDINLDRAEDLGFVKAEDVKFISRKTANTGLSLKE